MNASRPKQGWNEDAGMQMEQGLFPGSGHFEPLQVWEGRVLQNADLRGS